MLIRLYEYHFLPRKGLILQYGDTFGEIAPLPGFSAETFEEAKAELIQILPNLSLATLPSVRWGISCAQKKLPSVHLPLSALHSPKPGCATLKLKLGHLSLESAIALVKQHYRTHRLRLDCNRAWPLSQALAFARHFEPADFDYLEEPVRTFDELIRFSQTTRFPIAIDESFHSDWSAIPSLKAIVVKPTVVGSIPQIPPHLDLVLSSSYETGLGLLHIARAAQELHLASPIGLDTVKDDLLTTPISTAQGFFSWNFSNPPIHLSKLCPIAL